jgi:sugar phosphate isomerase/epimerase
MLLLTVFAVATLGVAAAPQVDPSPDAAGGSGLGSEDFLRGVVVSCPRAGQIWGSAEMAASLGELALLGVDWVAIHPYARVQPDGSVRYRRAESLDYLQRAVELARDARIRLFWKPHLAYWGSFAWRGEIQFGGDEEAWRRFFDGYRDFIVDQARFAEKHGVELLAVGVEYEQTTQREAEWRRIIADVRRVYSGRLTYAANWDSLDRVGFWDAVDLIGVHAYFPLSSDSDPDREALRRGWDEPLRQLADLSRRYLDRPVLLAEIGYSRSAAAASQPWEARIEDGLEVQQLRRRLIDVALERVAEASFIAGMFWWKWIPGPDPWDRDFSMKDAEARQALQRHWGKGRAAETSPAAAVVSGSGQ